MAQHSHDSTVGLAGNLQINKKEWQTAMFKRLKDRCFYCVFMGSVRWIKSTVVVRMLLLSSPVPIYMVICFSAETLMHAAAARLFGLCQNFPKTPFVCL